MTDDQYKGIMGALLVITAFLGLIAGLLIGGMWK